MQGRGQAGTNPDLQGIPGADATGDPTSLLHALGVVSLLPAVAGGVGAEAEAAPMPNPCGTLEALEHLMAAYCEQLLVRVEWPVVARAYGFAAAGQPRELIDFDASLVERPALVAAREASVHIGRLHLRRLRPLRDLRWLKRYREAVDAGQAHGWHLVVYAAILAAYALPLRQGLIGYARQSLTAVGCRAAKGGVLAEVEVLTVVERCLEGTLSTMQRLPGFDTPFVRCERITG